MGRNKELKEPVHVGCEIEKYRYNQLDEIRWREHKDRAEVLRLAIDEFIQRHGEGNPVYTLEQFQDPNFKAMPAFMTPMLEWKKFIMENTDKKELKEIDMKARSIVAVCRDKEKEYKC